MLVDAVRRATLSPRAHALDLCSGSGAVAIAAALADWLKQRDGGLGTGAVPV